MRRFLFFLSFNILLFVFLASFSSAAIVGASPASISFSNVLRGGYAERPLTITIDAKAPVEVRLEPLGELSYWLNFSESVFNVSSAIRGRPLISVRPPRDVPNGNYTGFVRVSTSQLPDELSQGHAAGRVLSVIDVYVTVEIIDREILACGSRGASISSVEVGEDLSLRLDVRNDGNIRLRPEVNVKLWDQEQLTLIKEFSLVGSEVLPTQDKTLSFTLSSAGIEEGQYWAEVFVLDCFSSELLTFDILEEGALRSEGILIGIVNKPVVYVDETTSLDAFFKNTGEKSVKARFKGTISQEGRIVQVLESEESLVPLGETANFTFFFTPSEEGKYIASGRVFYDRKRTFESSSVFTAISKGLPSYMYYLIYGLAALIFLYLIYRIRVDRARFLEAFKR